MEGYACEARNDEETIRRFTFDRSGYSLTPKAVAFPKNEDEILCLIENARETGVPIIPRAAGSNLSGNAVGEGTIVVMTDMNEFISSEKGKARLQPGLVYDKLNELMKKDGFFLPYHVSSSAFCTIGGNVATRASGLRSINTEPLITRLEISDSYLLPGVLLILQRVFPMNLKGNCWRSKIDCY